LASGGHRISSPRRAEDHVCVDIDVADGGAAGQSSAQAAVGGNVNRSLGVRRGERRDIEGNNAVTNGGEALVRVAPAKTSVPPPILSKPAVVEVPARNRHSKADVVVGGCR